MEDRGTALDVPVEFERSAPVHLSPLDGRGGWIGRAGGERANPIAIFLEGAKEVGTDGAGAPGDEESVVGVAHETLPFGLGDAVRGRHDDDGRLPQVSAELFGEADGEDDDHHRGVGVSVGGKDRAARDVQSPDAVDLGVGIDDAMGRIFGHASGAGGMGGIVKFGRLVIAFVDPRHRLRSGESEAGELLDDQGGEARDAAAFLVSDAPVDARQGDAEAVPTFGEGDAAGGVGGLFDHGVEDEVVEVMEESALLEEAAAQSLDECAGMPEDGNQVLRAAAFGARFQEALERVPRIVRRADFGQPGGAVEQLLVALHFFAECDALDDGAAAGLKLEDAVAVAQLAVGGEKEAGIFYSARAEDDEGRDDFKAAVVAIGDFDAPDRAVLRMGVDVGRRRLCRIATLTVAQPSACSPPKTN